MTSDRDPGESGPLAAFDRLPEGWSPATLDGRRYAVIRTRHAGGRSESVYAEELGGDVVSTNLYRTTSGPVLKPCEMPAAKVRAFLARAVPAARYKGEALETQRPPGRSPGVDDVVGRS